MLELEDVSKRYRSGHRRVEVLREVSLEVHEREVVAIWGPRNSGRSTLLRIAAGIEAPDSGSVRLGGRPLGLGGGSRPHGVAYCKATSRSIEGLVVFEELIAAQLALGVKLATGRTRAWEVLERVGARGCEGRLASELSRAEAVRTTIARALLQQPSLLVIDEPTTGVEPLERNKILELLRSLLSEGTSILMSLDRGVGLFAADRALALSDGELRGDVTPELAPVVDLPLRLSG